MRTELFIEGQRLDLSDEIQAQLSFAIDDVKDFGSKNTSYSKTITVPGNGKNNQIFGFIFDLGRSTDIDVYDNTAPNVLMNYNAANTADCLITVDQVQVFRGIIRVLTIVKNGDFITYECAVFGDLAGFMANLGANLLTGNTSVDPNTGLVGPNTAADLDFSAYNQNWSTFNISTSWSAAPGSGVYYPLIDYGLVSTNKHDFDFAAFRPALYVREYMMKIIAAAGYTVTSAFFNTTFFKSLIIPHNQDNLYNPTTELITNNTVNQTTLNFTGGIETTPSAEVYWSSTILRGFTSPTVPGKEFVYNLANTITITANISLHGTYRAFDCDLIIELFKNGVTTNWTRELPAAGNGTPFSLNMVATINVATGDILSVNVRRRLDPTISIPAPEYNFVVYSGVFTVRSVQIQEPQALPGDPLSINACIPQGIQQSDFFVSILKLFNLYVIENKDVQNGLIIEPYVTFYDLTQRENWTYKLDRGEEIRITPMAELNARYFDFSYEDDSDYWNDYYKKTYSIAYGSFRYDSNYQFTDADQEVKLIFAGSPMLGYVGQDKVFPAIYKLSTVEERTASKPRILQAKHITGVTSWALTNLGSTLVNYTQYGYAGHLDDPTTPTIDLNFGAPQELFFLLTNPYPSVNMFNYYYSSYLAEIAHRDSKLFLGYFRLTAQDIYNLDFSKCYVIDGVPFRLNQVIDFDGGTNDPTQVELLKVIELIY